MYHITCQLWKNINILLHRSSLPALPYYDSLSLLSQSVANFFSDKIHKLHTSLLINRISTSPHFPPPFTPPNFSSFTCVTTDEVSKLLSQSPDTSVLGMTLNCIHISIVTGSLLYWYVMRPASQRFFIHSCIYLHILIISYLATFLGTNSLSVLMCRKAVNQSINQSSH